MRYEDHVLECKRLGCLQAQRIFEGVTRDPEPALDALGLTEQEIAGDKRLCAAYLTARRQEAA